MALIKPYFADIRGKVGGSIFSVNRGGSYQRCKVTPLNPQTEAQQAVRSTLSAIAKGYASLTDEQRAGWKRLADAVPYRDVFGDTKKLNAIAIFIKVNAVLARTAEDGLVDAPENLNVTPIDELVVALVDSPSRTFSVDYSPLNTLDDALICYAAVSVPSSVGFVKNLYRICAVGGGNLPSPWTITSPVALGPFVVGTKLHVKVSRVNNLTGGTTLPLERSVLIT